MYPDYKLLRLRQSQPKGIKAGIWVEMSFAKRKKWLLNAGYKDGNTYHGEDGKVHKMRTDFVRGG
jgi:hypothetical protein